MILERQATSTQQKLQEQILLEEVGRMETFGQIRLQITFQVHVRMRIEIEYVMII